MLFYIELGSRRVQLAGCMPNPDSAWVAQQARQLARTLPERVVPLRFLVRDRDSKFMRDFDTVFRREGVELASPARSDDVMRRDRLGGLIHEYSLAA